MWIDETKIQKIIGQVIVPADKPDGEVTLDLATDLAKYMLSRGLVRVHREEERNLSSVWPYKTAKYTASVFVLDPDLGDFVRMGMDL